MFQARIGQLNLKEGLTKRKLPTEREQAKLPTERGEPIDAVLEPTRTVPEP